jgi:hypothetical protein
MIGTSSELVGRSEGLAIAAIAQPPMATIAMTCRATFALSEAIDW